MIYPIVGMLAATWLLIVPFLGLEGGFRAGAAVLGGVVALLLAFASIWSSRAGSTLTFVGVLLAIVNLLVPTSMAGMAELSVAAITLAVAGMAPEPAVTVTDASEVQSTGKMVRTASAHTSPARPPAPAPA